MKSYRVVECAVLIKILNFFSSYTISRTSIVCVERSIILMKKNVTNLSITSKISVSNEFYFTWVSQNISLKNVFNLVDTSFSFCIELQKPLNK